MITNSNSHLINDNNGAVDNLAAKLNEVDFVQAQG